MHKYKPIVKDGEIERMCSKCDKTAKEIAATIDNVAAGTERVVLPFLLQITTRVASLTIAKVITAIFTYVSFLD